MVILSLTPGTAKNTRELPRLFAGSAFDTVYRKISGGKAAAVDA